MLQTIKYRLTGVCPLIMHNGQTADPLNEHTRRIKSVSKIKSKSDEQFEELSRLEWLAGLYEDEEGYPCLSADAITAVVIEGAKKSRLGKQFAPAVFAESDARLDIGDRRKARDLWGDSRYVDYRSVRVNTSRVMRTRPRFDKWAATIELLVNTAAVNGEQVLAALRDAGSQVGLCDFRPRFGRFDVAEA